MFPEAHITSGIEQRLMGGGHERRSTLILWLAGEHGFGEANGRGCIAAFESGASSFEHTFDSREFGKFGARNIGVSGI